MRVPSAKRRPSQVGRPPVVRMWSGPLIGREPEPVEAYVARMEKLLADVRTHVYYDASFLMWLAKLGEQAREEFLAWQRSIGEARFHVPLWAGHEYYKHRLKKTVPTEIKQEIKAFDSAAANLYEKLRTYCSDQLFGFKDSGILFMDEYRRVVQPLRAMLKLAEGSDQFDMSVQQVATYIDSRLLSGPLSEVVAEIDADERVRNRGVIPPSFKDAHKRGGQRGEGSGDEAPKSGDNSFGDLALWREVLRHASAVRAGAIVVLTADRKNDWFENRHGDAGLTGEIRKQLGRPRPVPAPHPLLIREAFDRGAGDLVLIDPMYCGVLIERSAIASASFSSAALDIHLPEPEKKPSAARSWARRFGPQAKLLGDGLISGAPVDRIDFFDSTTLNVELLRATSPVPQPEAQTIRRIEEGDPVFRAAELANLNFAALEAWVTPSLVALGRVALRAADAGDIAALEFLSSIRDRSPELAPAVREPLFFGALGAIYFDDSLGVRVPSGSHAAALLLSLVTAPEVRRSALALGEALSERKLLYRPGATEALCLNVIIQPSANNKAPADLLAIKLAGVDLMTTLQTEEDLRFAKLLGQPPGAADAAVGALIEVLSRYHLLPRQLIESETNVDVIVRVPEYAGVELEI